MASEQVEMPLDTCKFLISNDYDQPLRIFSQVDACIGVSEKTLKANNLISKYAQIRLWRNDLYSLNTINSLSLCN